jgi:hypothetical protein
MSKNTTRKGLALGAGLGLIASGFVGIAPATAAETLSLAPTAGTSYKVLTSTVFELTANFSGSESSAAVDTIKYLVTNASGATVLADVTAAGSAAGTTTYKVVGTGVTSAGTATSFVVADETADALGTRSGLALSITPVEATSASITVQAFLDTDGSDSITGNEATSPARTIEFTDHASITGSATLDTAVIGGTTLSAVGTLDGINYDQLDANDVTFEFFKNNVTITTTPDSATSASTAVVTVAARTNPNTAAWSAGLGELRATLTPDGDAGANDTVYAAVANVAGAVYSAKIRLFDGTNYVTVANSAGAATASTGQVSALTAITESASVSTDGSDNVRVGSGSFTANTTATVNAGFAKSGQTVTFTVTETTANVLAAAASVTAGGKTLTNSNITTVQKFTVDVLTDAKGIASLDVAYVGLVAGNTFNVSATALNTAAAATPAAAITYTALASNVVSAVSNVKAGKLQTVVASSFGVSWNIVDAFGQTPTGTFRLVLSEDSASANYAQTISFVNGVASFTQTENSTVANAYALAAAVQKQNTDLSWDATPSAANGAVAGNVLVQAYATDPTVTAIAVSPSATGIGALADLALELDTTFTGDTVLVKNSVVVPTLAVVSTLTYTVSSSTGEALVGETVTVSAAGLQFKSGTVHGVGTLTATTDAAGQFAVEVSSNFAGSHTVTATVGGVVKTQELVFAAAKDDTATSLVLSAPSNVEKGNTFKVTATLTDKYGNPVTTLAGTNFNNGTTAPTFSITYTGPGLVISTPAGTTNGVAEFSVLLGSNDSSAIAVSASYDADGTDAVFAALAATASVTIGAAVVVSDTKVNVGSFKGFVALYAKGYEGKKMSAIVAGKWIVVASLASDFERVVRYTGAGYDIVTTIYIDGVMVQTFNVTTK